MQGKISKLHNMLVNREITAAELAEKYFDSIEKYDGTLNAYITVTKDEAMAQAKKVDEMIAEGKEIPMLAGIPMTIKDNISTKGILTSCASKILSNYKPVYNAFAAEQVLNSGAVLLGKTNLDEFGMGSTCENSYYGATKNPYNPEHVPGGSSGGGASPLLRIWRFLRSAAIPAEVFVSRQASAVWWGLSLLTEQFRDGDL